MRHDRARTSVFEREPAVPAAGTTPSHALPSGEAGFAEDTALHSAHQRILYAASLLWVAADDARLARQGHEINRKRPRRLMRLMGLAAIYRKPNLSRANAAHRVHPYLLRGLPVLQSNQVWATDIT